MVSFRVLHNAFDGACASQPTKTTLSMLLCVCFFPIVLLLQFSYWLPPFCHFFPRFLSPFLIVVSILLLLVRQIPFPPPSFSFHFPFLCIFSPRRLSFCIPSSSRLPLEVPFLFHLLHFLHTFSIFFRILHTQIYLPNSSYAVTALEISTFDQSKYHLEITFFSTYHEALSSITMACINHQVQKYDQGHSRPSPPLAIRPRKPSFS